MSLNRKEKLSLDDLARTTGRHKSSVSRSIQNLREMGLVKKDSYILTVQGLEQKRRLAEEVNAGVYTSIEPLKTLLAGQFALLSKTNQALQRSLVDYAKLLSEATQTISQRQLALILELANYASHIMRPIFESAMEYKIFQQETLIPAIVSLQLQLTQTAELQAMESLEYQKRLTNQLANFALKFQAKYSKLLTSLHRLADACRFFEEEDFKKFELNWLAFLPVTTMKHMYELHKAGQDREIWHDLKKLHKNKEYLDQLILDFSSCSIFEPRMKIIEDSLKAHLRGEYTLSIPSLLPQVEGIIWSIGEKIGVVEGRNITTTRGKKIKARSGRDALLKTKIKEVLFPYFVEYFANKVYVGSQRHGILHGRIVTYHDEETSVKMILMLCLLHHHAENL